MAISNSLKSYLDQSGIAYDTVKHAFATSSQRTAEVAHVSGRRLAKGVLLYDGVGYLLAVLPSPMHVNVEELSRMLNRSFELVDEEEIPQLFPDCEEGAIPPVGKPFKLDVVLDIHLCEEPDIYFEGGDHVDLVLVGGTDFQTLLSDAEQLCFAE